MLQDNPKYCLFYQSHLSDKIWVAATFLHTGLCEEKSVTTICSPTVPKHTQYGTPSVYRLLNILSQVEINPSKWGNNSSDDVEIIQALVNIPLSIRGYRLLPMDGIMTAELCKFIIGYLGSLDPIQPFNVGQYELRFTNSQNLILELNKQAHDSASNFYSSNPKLTSGVPRFYDHLDYLVTYIKPDLARFISLPFPVSFNGILRL